MIIVANLQNFHYNQNKSQTIIYKLTFINQQTLNDKNLVN